MTSTPTSPVWYGNAPAPTSLEAVDRPIVERRFDGVADLPDVGSRRDPRWARPAFAVLLVGTALLYLINLGASGNANSFYAAAVQAGTLSWKAFFFGSLDASNYITVDKPPMSLWPMELAGRVFGFNSWSMLVPQALMGVAAVALLYATVKRWFGPAAGLIAGAVLALTPVAVLMFRFNNPDALMVLLLVAGAYCLTRAIETARLRWIVLVGVTFGFGFLTKGLQPFTMLPVAAIAYLLFAPTSWGRRLLHLLVGAAAVVVSAGWWVLAVLLWPAADRPYIGGSTNNNPLELAFGYNGLGRLTGNESGGTGGTGSAATGGGGGGGASFSGTTGFGRLFNSEMGGQISWLLPAALIALVGLVAAAVVGRRRGVVTRRLLVAATIWGGWLIVTGAVLSFASGTIHPYYTVQLAPAIGALVGIGLVTAWRLRAEIGTRALLAAAVAVTAVWSFALLGRSADYYPTLRWVVLIVGLVTAVAVLAAGVLRRTSRPLSLAVAAGLLIALLGGSGAYAATTASTAQQGSMPSAGPAVSGGGFGSGTGGPGGFGGRAAGSGTTGAAGTGPAGGFPGGGLPGTNGSGSGAGTASGRGGTSGTGGTTDGAARTGGFGGGATADSAVVALLQNTSTRWAAATIGSQTAASLELASGGKAVMAIGGFTGSDASSTLAQFQALVAAGDVHYFIAGGGMGGGGQGNNSEITTWVEQNFTATTVGSSTVYDLTSPITATGS